MLVRVVGLPGALKQLRDTTGWSLARCAYVLDVSKSTIERWLREKGDRRTIEGRQRYVCRAQRHSINRLQRTFRSEIKKEAPIEVFPN